MEHFRCVTSVPTRRAAAVRLLVPWPYRLARIMITKVIKKKLDVRSYKFSTFSEHFNLLFIFALLLGTCLFGVMKLNVNVTEVLKIKYNWSGTTSSSDCKIYVKQLI